MPRTAARLLLAALLGAAPAAVAAPGTAQAAAGFDVQITELPGRFVAGEDPSTVTVVASTDVGRRCQKVRWSLVLRVNGISLDQVRVDRVEDSGSFPLAVQAGGDTARLTDRDLDPGELCPDRTVTARYRLGFDEEVTDGAVTLQAGAFNRLGQLLEESSVTRDVVAEAGAAPTPSDSPTPEESESAEVDEGDTASPTDEPSPDPSGGVASVPAAGTGRSTSLLGVGLIVGAVLIFLGVGILLRMRLRNREPRALG